MNPVTSARLVCSLAVVLAGLLYVNALDNPFIYDDHRVIVENRALATPGNFRAVIGHDATRPVAAISYGIDRALWGRGPFGFHATNVLLHMINVALFGLLAWRMAGDRRQRASAATLP